MSRVASHIVSSKDQPSSLAFTILPKFRLSCTEVVLSYSTYNNEVWWTDIRKEGTVKQPIGDCNEMVSGTLLSGKKIAVVGKRYFSQDGTYNVYVEEL